MNFNRARYELKFLLPVSAKSDFLEAVKFGLNLDPHAGQRGGYQVTSLYYDSPDLHAFYEKLDGVLRRRKFRLRFYNHPTDAPEVSFFEIKHRYSNLIAKERMLIPPDLSEALLRGESQLDALGSLEESYNPGLVDRLLTYHHTYILRPALFVSYYREAWVGLEEDDLRVTFDHDLTVNGPDDYPASGVDAGRYFLDPGQTVLEVKFNNTLPRWLQQRLVHYRLRPVRYSKYVEAGLAIALQDRSIA